MRALLLWMTLVIVLLAVVVLSEDSAVVNHPTTTSHPHLYCRDPEIGAGQHTMKNRKFLMITGHGGGIGNFLIFFPAAYYFAALTGRVSLLCRMLPHHSRWLYLAGYQLPNSWLLVAFKMLFLLFITT